MSIRILFSFWISIILSQVVFAQSCCSGGVPVSSNIGFQSGESMTLQLGLSIDFNHLSRLFSGSDKLDDKLRRRTTQSYLIRSAYNISQQFTIEGFLPFIKQTRKIYSSTAIASDFDETFGIGDPVILFIYDLIQSPFVFRFGLGPQVPMGSSTKKNDQGLFLVEDLQPGSGAWDFIMFSSIEYNLSYRPSTLLFLNSIYSFNGVNSDSRGGSQKYHFGNDIQIIAGISDQLIIANQAIYPSLAGRYRFAKRDEINDIANSGTGGEWLFLKVSISIPFVFSSSLAIHYEFPVYSFVNETQLSPDRIINFSLYKTFSFQKSASFDQIINF